MRMNKKGDEYGPPILAVIVTVIIFVYLSIILIDKINGVNKTIGDTQYKLLNTYDNAEKINFYIDESAKRAANSALYNLAKNGGIAEQDCSEYFGSFLLVSQDEDCMPKEESDITNEYLSMFNKEFKVYLSNYQYVKINSEYDLNYYEGILVGISQDKVTLPITSRIIQELSKANETLIQKEKIDNLQGSTKVVEIAKTQIGKHYPPKDKNYVGGKPLPSISNPIYFDCAGLTGWAIGSAGVQNFPIPSSAKDQYNYMKNKNTIVYDSTSSNPSLNNVENYKRSLSTPGILLFSFPPEGAWYTGHVGLTIGDGSNIIEAGGNSRSILGYSGVAISKAYWNSGKPKFDVAGTIPGLNYSVIASNENQQNTNIIINITNSTNNTSQNKTNTSILQIYNFEYLISDEEFTNKNAANQEQIQKFLEKQGSRLKDPIDGELPSKMIYDVAQKEGINPIVLLVTLQKEKSLITLKNPSQNQLDAAMGCGCHDGASCQVQFKGFKNQISCSATTVLKRWYEDGKNKQYPLTMKGINYGGKCSKNSNTGPNTVIVKNAATYALYKYTPHTYDICLGNGQLGGGNKLFLTNYKNYYKSITGNEIGISYSTNDLTDITGESISSIGAYSFTPAFEIEMGYDFSVYKKIFDTMLKLNYKYNDLVGEDKEKFMDNIVNEAKAVDSSVDWFKNCETPEEKMYYSFAEEYYLCANSPDNNCYCEMKIYPQANLNNFNFILSTTPPEGNEGSQFLLRGDSNDEIVSEALPGFKRDYTLNTGIVSGDVKINGKIVNSDLIMNIEIPNSNGYETYDYKDNVLNPFFMYKEKINNDMSRLSFIAPYSVFRDGVTKSYYDKVKEDYDKSKNNMQNTYKACRVQKDTVKLCVNSDKKILIYDKSKNNITFVDNTIKFAYTFRDILPPLAIYDIVSNNDIIMMDKSLILKWSHENKYDDILNFRIYYSKNDFDGKSLKEIKNDANIKVIDLDKADNIIPLGIDISKPEFKVENMLLKDYYVNMNFNLEQNEVYEFSKNNQEDLITNYAAKVSFDSNEQYYILISAYDNKNNEIGIDSEKINYKEIKVKDNLAPATYPLNGFNFDNLGYDENGKIVINFFGKPAKNIDGSDFNPENELSGYNVYYIEDKDKMDKDIFFALTPIFVDKLQDKVILDIDSSKGWYYYVVPVDINGNMQFKKETGQLMDNQNFFNPKHIAPKT